MECNQGSFLLTISRDGHGQARRIMEPCEDKISIQTMTTMLMGYKRPEYLAKIGRIQAAEWTIDMLEDAIEQQTPYISDYFSSRQAPGLFKRKSWLHDFPGQAVLDAV